MRIAALVSFLAAPCAAQDAQPYAGQDTRAIAALSEDELAGLRAGAGLGYAKAAELNGYPGPRHVLDLADELELSDEARAKVQAIFDAMQADAVDLGERLIAEEAELDHLFAEGEADEEAVAALTARIALTEGRLRAVHLEAHLVTAPILTRHQRMIYATARGYGGGHDGPGSH